MQRAWQLRIRSFARSAGVEGILGVHDDATGEQPDLALAADPGPAVVVDGDAEGLRGFQHRLIRGHRAGFPRAGEGDRGARRRSSGRRRACASRRPAGRDRRAARLGDANDSTWIDSSGTPRSRSIRRVGSVISVGPQMWTRRAAISGTTRVSIAGVIRPRSPVQPGPSSRVRVTVTCRFGCRRARASSSSRKMMSRSVLTENTRSMSPGQLRSVR